MIRWTMYKNRRDLNNPKEERILMEGTMADANTPEEFFALFELEPVTAEGPKMYGKFPMYPGHAKKWKTGYWINAHNVIITDDVTIVPTFDGAYETWWTTKDGEIRTW